MKVFVSMVAAIAFSASVLAPAARADDKSEIRAVIAQVESAFKNKDVKALVATSTDDFSTKMINGQTLKGKQAEEMMKEQFASIKSVSNVKMACGKITVKGKTATTVCSSSMSAVMVDPKGQMGKAGATHKMVSTGTSKVDLVKGKKGWKVKYVEDLTENTTIDGKKMPMGAPPSAPPKKK
jgi:ketosteroid isomerase-like protein